MPLMTWDNSFDIGVEPMNREHREILDAMNAVYDAAEAGEKGAAMMARITRLAQVTTRHFHDEEAYMQRTGFPDYPVHKTIHDKLLKDFGDHVARIQANGGVPGREFFSFLRLWLSSHIKCIDKRYGDHARAA